ncbi:MAG: SigE family RNA polymerase sigma factor, partial [Actinomycetia bacterium]|nr:SigE family RNA polymerase sigma factor [Actinomycetes bacterium]
MSDSDTEFTALFRVEYPRVLRTMSLVLYDRSEAEDITQDAFAQLHRHWRRVSRFERPDAWVRTV